MLCPISVPLCPKAVLPWIWLFFKSCVVYNRVFRSRLLQLDWFIEPDAAVQLFTQDGHMSRSVRRFCPIVPAKAPCTLPEAWRHSDGVLSRRNNAIEAHFPVDCRVVVPSLADKCKAQTYLFTWNPLQCDVNRNKLPRDSEIELQWQSGQESRICYGHGAVPRLSPEDERAWERGSQILNKERELWLCKLKIKIPAIYSRLFILYFLS